jgi:hypothetical protein
MKAKEIQKTRGQSEQGRERKSKRIYQYSNDGRAQSVNVTGEKRGEAKRQIVKMSSRIV